MKIGTKSVLFGAHCFLTHWIFVAWGWFRVYGWRVKALHPNWRADHASRESAVIAFWHPWLWIAFFVHDIGYLGKPNMDGPEGEEHPWTGARILYWLQGLWLFLHQRVLHEEGRNWRAPLRWWHLGRRWASAHLAVAQQPVIWGNEALYHSRFLAKRYETTPSQLCMADKMAIVLTPAWLYLPMVRATGEIVEYMGKSSAMNATGSKYCGLNLDVSSQRAWHADMVRYVAAWIEEHRDGRADTWTPTTKEAVTASGVWK